MGFHACIIRRVGESRDVFSSSSSVFGLALLDWKRYVDVLSASLVSDFRSAGHQLLSPSSADLMPAKGGYEKVGVILSGLLGLQSVPSRGTDYLKFEWSAPPERECSPKRGIIPAD